MDGLFGQPDPLLIVLAAFYDLLKLTFKKTIRSGKLDMSMHRKN
ncbi:MAG: Uncharacterised protein [Prochlorococcus marinus str. MIT 9215]|jgi:hypothetical protein|nr:MAG: Uncharacterised protein [Prochlorococcus marinus str. MIT 9215]